jgi:hypothetical protein
MRKIEALMNKAITKGENFKMKNTEVITEDGVSSVFLHNNKIAEIGDNFVRLFDGNFQSNTTKSRLNAILSEHGVDGEGVFQKAGVWFVRVNEPFKVDHKIVPFSNGMLVE